MKFNISKKDARFIVNKDKKKVVCIIEDTNKCFIKFVDENLPIKSYCNDYWHPSRLENKLFMPNKFIGVATCSDDDEWNEETGKLIAFSRAKDKLNKSFFKRANTYINCLDKWTNEAAATLRNIGNKLTINTQHRHNLIKSIIGDDE